MVSKLPSKKQRGRRSTDAIVDVRELLLDVATHLFSERGVAGTTVAQIASAVGVTPAMVHYYFTNREKLLDAVVDERVAPSAAFVWQPATEAATSDPFVLAHAFIDRLFDVTGRMPWLPSLWLREIVNEGGLLRSRMLKRIPFDNIRRFGGTLTQAQKEGVVNAELEPGLLFNSILALVMIPLATAKIMQNVPGIPAVERDMLRRHVTALLIGGMQPPRRPLKAKRHAPQRSKP
jgi:AcrR family transcriptional regulator